MFLQVTQQIDSLDSLTQIMGQDQTGLFLLIVGGSIAIVITIWVLLRKGTKKQSSQHSIQQSTSKTKQAVETVTESRTVSTIKSKPDREPKKTLTKNKSTKKAEQLRVEENKVINALPEPSKPQPVEPLPEEQSQPKYIGYNPINIFEQTEPYSFPYVIMPKPRCIIKFPRKGRTGRKGFKEDEFKTFLKEHFSKAFKIYDDRFITVKGSSKPYEPDITFTNEKNGINIFLDIEIDEPYEGLNDITLRNASHYQYADTNRNNAFKKRGWVVIRFAEIQVHKEPLQCCSFVADVIKSINSNFEVPSSLAKAQGVTPVKQWTKEEADQWSREKYREQYLDIESFGLVPETEKLEGVEETDLGEQIENEVEDEPSFIPPKDDPKVSGNPKREIVKSTIKNSKFLAFDYAGIRTFIKPLDFIDSNTFIGECYLKNKKRVFSLYYLQNPAIKQTPVTVQEVGPNLGIDRIRNIVNIAIKHGKFIRMTYTISARSELDVDEVTGEFFLNKIEGETSIRTISNVDFALNVLAEELIEQYNLRNEEYEYLTAYCHKREDKRTFRFDRISKIAILDL